MVAAVIAVVEGIMVAVDITAVRTLVDMDREGIGMDTGTLLGFCGDHPCPQS